MRFLCFVQAGRRGSLATASVWVTYTVAWTPHGEWVQKLRHPPRTSHSTDGSTHLDKVAGGRSPPNTSEISSDMLPRTFPGPIAEQDFFHSYKTMLHLSFCWSAVTDNVVKWLLFRKHTLNLRMDSAIAH